MKKILIVLSALFLIAACGHRSGSLYKMAVAQLPVSLDDTMREYMHTVEKPLIKGIQPIYDCDSICVLQCKAYARDESGNYCKETVRYFFIKDPFLSVVSGTPTYGDYILGGKYLDKKGIAAFQKSMKDGGAEKFNYYLGRISPLQTPIPLLP